MASVEISLRALTVSRQRASGILLKVVHKIWAQAVANVKDGLLVLHDNY
jgi:hypothetical protein